MSIFWPQISKKLVIQNFQQIRYLPRWSHRRPVRVIPPEEYDNKTDAPLHPEKSLKEPLELNIEENMGFKSKIKWKQPDPLKMSKFAQSKEKTEHFKPTPKPLTLLSKKQTSKKEKPSFDMLQTLIDENGNFVYTKMENNDLRIAEIMMELKSKKEKDKKDLMLLEGKRLIIEALNASCKLEYILFSRMKELEEIKPYLPKLGAKLFKVPYREMQMWSELTTNPGIMGLFKIPDLNKIKVKNPIRLTVICDNIREPNNLGAILRTCCGVGCEKVMLTKGCVNVWDSKVLRSSSGAHFHIKISKKLDWDEICKQIPDNSTVFIADNTVVSSKNESSDSLSSLLKNIPVLPYFDVNFKMAEYTVLIIGGETEGISEESYQMANDFNGVRLNIPLNNNLDSLNTGTALAVIAFEIKRQLLSRQENQIKETNSV